MARFDPKLGYLATGVPDNAVGTLDELEEARLPVELFPSCSAGSTARGIRGCQFEDRCTMSYRGMKVEDGGGPRNHGWEHIKGPVEGGAIVRSVQPCYWGVSRQDVVNENGGVLRVIADEGEEIEILTTAPKPKPTDPLNREQMLLKIPVRPFKRLNENQKVAQAMLRADLTKKEEQRVANERAGEILGVGTSTPLNRRGRKVSADTPKEG